MVTTRQAAPAVRLNAKWRAKYRERAEQSLLSAHYPHHAGDCKLLSETPLLPRQQQACDCNSQTTNLHHQKLTTVSGDEEVHLETLHLQQVAISAGDGDLLPVKKSASGQKVGLYNPHQHSQEAWSNNGEPLSVCIVGRSGVGKGSLINHLLQERGAKVSHFEGDCEKSSFEYQGLFSIREIPGYDGWHSVDSPSWRHERLFRRHHDSSHSSHSHSSKSHSSHSHSSSHGCNSSSTSMHSRHNSGGDGSCSPKGRKLTLDEFVQIYGLFEAETRAIIFVVNSRVTPADHKLMELAIENRKFFCIVCTHADNLVQIADNALLKRKLEELEERLRRDLNLIQRLNVRVFFLSIPFPEGQGTGIKLKGQDLQCVLKNTQNLHFPLLKAYLLEPRGLLDELQIHGFVEEEVWKVLKSFQIVRKRDFALDFAEHLVAGAIVPIIGPVMVSFINTLYYTLKACSEVGLIEDAEDAMKKVTADPTWSTKMASREALVTAMQNSMIDIFGEIVFEIAIDDVVSTVAETALMAGIPLVGDAILAMRLPGLFKKIAKKLGAKACLLHELWVMQNITGLLERTK